MGDLIRPDGYAMVSVGMAGSGLMADLCVLVLFGPG